MWRYIHSHLQGRDPFGQQHWRKGPRLCGREVYSVRKYVFLHFTYFLSYGPTPPSLSPHAVKEMQDTLGFWIPRCGFRIPCEWNFSLFSPGVQFAPSHHLNSQNRLVQLWIPESKSLWDFGFLEPSSGFQSPDFKFPNLHHLEWSDP